LCVPALWISRLCLCADACALFITLLQVKYCTRCASTAAALVPRL
jgi:hypothetical protein